MAEPIIRLTRPTDINSLTDLDLKSYHYPLGLEEWQVRIKGSGKPNESKIVVTEIYNKPVAYAVWNVDKEHNGIYLERLGVLPKFRRNGLGTRLVMKCIQDGFDQFCEEARVIASSLYCQPGHEDDISVFLNSCGFETNGQVVHDMDHKFGEPVDGYIFVRKIDVNPRRLRKED